MVFEITVVCVGVDAQYKFLGITFRVELGGVHVLTDAEHLYRAVAVGHQ